MRGTKIKLFISFVTIVFSFNTIRLHAQSPAEQPMANLANQATKNFPVPAPTKKLLFYLQRNKNSNTVVYEANIMPNGKLDPKNPVDVHWIRYTEGGVIKELNWIQRWVAFGVDAEPAKDGSGNYILSFVALKHRKVTLNVDHDGKASAFIALNGKLARLNRLYAQAEETNWLPTVKFVQLRGEDVKTKQEIYEYIVPKQ